MMTQDAADRQAMIEVLARYAWGYDMADFAMLADTFTEDATSGGVVTGTDIAWGPMKGRAEIVSVLEGIRQGQTDQRRHNVSNIFFTARTETTASMTANLSLASTEGGETRLLSAGYYTMDFVKQGETWRMSRLDGVLDAPF